MVKGLKLSKRINENSSQGQTINGLLPFRNWQNFLIWRLRIYWLSFEINVILGATTSVLCFQQLFLWLISELGGAALTLSLRRVTVWSLWSGLLSVLWGLTYITAIGTTDATCVSPCVGGKRPHSIRLLNR